jgi:(4-(4-[2-(gamma-L-glutamylamino)ethyl]phenoxymethyl)furan-2-yl)methanamine synthase
VYRVLGDLPENPEDHNTADGRPATRSGSHARLARMVCADLESSTEAERLVLARLLAQRQEELLVRAIHSVLSRQRHPPRTLILAGCSAFLAERAWRRFLQRQPCAIVDLGRELGPDLSAAACAYAVAVLARERS